jgi:hypothetical protein
MKVPEALIALSSVRRGVRVVLCGDDRQLAPVLRGSYDEDARTRRPQARQDLHQVCYTASILCSVCCDHP